MDNIKTWRQLMCTGHGVARLDATKRSKVLSLSAMPHWYYRYWYLYQLDCGHTYEGCRSVKRKGFYRHPETISCPVCAFHSIRELSFDLALDIWVDYKVLAAQEGIEQFTAAAMLKITD